MAIRKKLIRFLDTNRELILALDDPTLVTHAKTIAFYSGLIKSFPYEDADAESLEFLAHIKKLRKKELKAYMDLVTELMPED